MDKSPQILLVNPRMTSLKGARLPLSLLALAAVLENRYDYRIIDGNIESDPANRIVALLGRRPDSLVACTVMPGPQVATAIEISSTVRSVCPTVPIIWGGYFPTLYPDSALNCHYVDYVARGQGEHTLLELLAGLRDAGSPETANGVYVSSCGDPTAISHIKGLSWKLDGGVIHNPDRGFTNPDAMPMLPYHRLDDIGQYLRPSFLGSRTGVHQISIGCRFRCGFCGVASMFNGTTCIPSANRLERDLLALGRLGFNAMQYYDNNFFDREENTFPLLEVMARHPAPWWCYARADALATASPKTWASIKASQLRMVYIGAEAADDRALKRMKKGALVEHTYEAAARCREHGIIPEFSFVLGGPDLVDPAADIENNFRFIKKLKQIHPECEVILYFHTPTPQRDLRHKKSDTHIPVMPMAGLQDTGLPATPEEWTEKRWLDFVCHQDAPWLTPELRSRVRDFSKVLYCRFPTVQDFSTPAWGKFLLKSLAGWRYASGRYGYSWELDLARRWVRLREPQREGL